MGKSHVSMAQHQCPVCLNLHDTGEILFDTRLRQVFKPTTVTGYSFCNKCQERHDEGFIALIETKDSCRGRAETSLREPRTGNYAWLCRCAFPAIFGKEAPDTILAFVEPGVLEKLMEMTEGPGENEHVH